MGSLQDLKSLIGEIDGLNIDSLVKTFELVASQNLSQCAKTGIHGFEALDKRMLGSNEVLTETILLDSIVLETMYSDEDVLLVTHDACLLSRLRRNGSTKYKQVGLEEQRSNVYGSLEGAIESEIEKVDMSIFDDEEEPWEAEREDNSKIKEVDEVEDQNTETEESASTPDDEELLSYYKPQINGIRDELLKRYTAMYASGYEVSKPAGVLAEEGLLRISGSELKVVECSASTTQMYSMFASLMGIEEVKVRAITKIANAVYSEYMAGSNKLLYFPYKIIEFAYGREPAGLAQESLRTYKEHADAKSWSKYRDGLLKKAVTRLLERSVLIFLDNFVTDGDKKSSSSITGVSGFLRYMQSCLSVGLIMIDYRVFDGTPSTLKLRVCDPNNSLGSVDYTTQIVQRAFVGGTGVDPYSYEPRIDEATFVKEYYHEFNHKVSQAMPLFAYKAMESLKDQGINIDWSTLILGKAEDGSILRNGSKWVSLVSNLTHHFIAGSRAGKGVATLNILAAAAASNKVIFYLDRKPDMASLLKSIAPNMFVVNGAYYIAEHDTYKTFTDRDSWINKANIPLEILNFTNDGSLTWNNLGDLFYMRALMLSIGFILARGVNGLSNSPKFGGSDGVLLVADEMSNFQYGYESVILKMFDYLPPNHSSFTINTAKLDTLEAGGDKKYAEYVGFKKQYDEAYNTASFYALSYLLSITQSMETANALRRAGFNDAEITMSDIMVLGQSAEYGLADASTYRYAVETSRIKNQMKKGIEKATKAELERSKCTAAYNFVSFRTSDAFYGWNRDNPEYLAQGRQGSKAFGRLDGSSSNFAYIKKYTDDMRKRIQGKEYKANVEIAKDAVYYKPFLVLNDSTSAFTEGMFNRCLEAGIEPDEVLHENPYYMNGTPNGPLDETKINQYTGFEAYIQYMGMQDYREVFERGAALMDRMLVEDLKYIPDPSSSMPVWFQFITDLRPEWIFTLQDIIDATAGNTPKLWNPLENPIFKEWVEWDKSYFSSPEGTEIDDEGPFSDDLDIDDFSDDTEKEDIRVSSALGDDEVFGEDEDFDLYDTTDDLEEFGTDDIEGETGEFVPKESIVSETGKTSNNLGASSEDLERIQELFNELHKLGIDVQVGSKGWSAKPVSRGKATGTDEYIRPDDVSSFDFEGENIFDTERIEVGQEDDIDSLERFMTLITNDVMLKFGGPERVRSFKVIGGSIIVNNYYYRCRIKDVYVRNIPYDICREINSGNVSKLFDYRILVKMLNVSSLEFDSASFVYDYVSRALGFGDSISVDKFFASFQMLQTLKIGNRIFTKQNFVEEAAGEDLFYKPKAISKLANATEDTFSKWSKGSYNWARKNWCDKNQKLWTRMLKGTTGIATSAVTWTGNKAVKVGRKVPKAASSLIGGLKDFFNS